MFPKYNVNKFAYCKLIKRRVEIVQIIFEEKFQYMIRYVDKGIFKELEVKEDQLDKLII